MITLEDLERTFNSLRRECRSVPILCIPWLHLKHPIHPVQQMLLDGRDEPEQPLAHTRPALKTRLARRIARSESRALRSAFCAVNGLRLSLRIVRLRVSLRNELRKLRKRRFAIVAKSWCFGPKPASPEQPDFYYGDLQKRLAARGVSMLLLCGDANDSNLQAFAEASISAERDFRVPELALCPPLAPVRVALDQIRSSQVLSRRFSTADESLTKSAGQRAALDCLDPAVTQDSLYFEIARSATRLWSPQVFMTLYEGHGWEKAAWWGARAESRRCRIAAYQHTAVFPESFSLLRPCEDMEERSLPDIVLALGDRTAALLRPGHPHRVRLIRFGSFRKTGPVTAGGPADPSRRTVLVLPEGIASEADVLFRFAYECARSMPSYRFILRGHPQWPATRALTYIDLPLRTLENVELSSNGAIQEDFDRSSLLLYRGSSSSLYGILSGLLAVNLQPQQMIASDPIHELSAWRRVCRTPTELKEVAERLQAMTPEERRSEWQQAIEYVNAYIAAVDDAGVETFLDAAGVEKTDLCTA